VWGAIEHAPWPLQPAEAELEADGLLAAAGVTRRDVAPLALALCPGLGRARLGGGAAHLT
jgi:hypothetical protein